ncbi:hypothetical protein SDC9_114351 [bioreactor metagenome]|uniref:Uncharacterized protein n=1 Tax=bioreactor metagenome TaxID=1076179 RepID=A0A645BPS2_9ZZZZ
MPHNHDQFGTGDSGRVFKAAKDVVIDEIARHARHEEVADTPIEYDFRRNPGIKATHNGSEGKLAPGCLLYLGEKVPLFGLSAEKALVTLLEHLQCLAGCDGGLDFPGHCSAAVGVGRSGYCKKNRHGKP